MSSEKERSKIKKKKIVFDVTVHLKWINVFMHVARRCYVDVVSSVPRSPFAIMSIHRCDGVARHDRRRNVCQVRKQKQKKGRVRDLKKKSRGNVFVSFRFVQPFLMMIMMNE